MIIPDINLLIYAIDPSSVNHDKAKNWWNAVLHAEETIALPWIIRLGLMRITMNSSIFLTPLNFKQVTTLLKTWTDLENVIDLPPTDQHLEIMTSLTTDIRIGHKTVTDLHIAALSVEYGATIYSNDYDFRRFRGVKWKNPLE